MNSNIILIAENDIENIENDIQVLEPPVPEYDNSHELPELPAAEPAVYYGTEEPPKTEMQTIAHKAFISFGLMAVFIVLILLFAFFYKKRKEAREEEIYEEYQTTEQAKTEEAEPEYIQSPVRKIKSSKLNTPSSIHKCIVSFLEITKEN